MDVSPGVVILGRWGTRSKSKVRKIDGDRGRSRGRSREVQRDHARSREIVGEVIRDGEGRADVSLGIVWGVSYWGHTRLGEIRGDQGRSREMMWEVREGPR